MVAMRSELGNFNEINGTYITMKKAFAYLFKFFLFFSFVTIAALGQEWLEGVKTMTMIFFFIISSCLFIVS